MRRYKKDSVKNLIKKCKLKVFIMFSTIMVNMLRLLVVINVLSILFANHLLM